VSRLVNCWCAKGNEPCDRKATAEDMLCDPCRAGCTQVGLLREDAPPVVLYDHALVSYS